MRGLITNKLHHAQYITLTAAIINQINICHTADAQLMLDSFISLNTSSFTYVLALDVLFQIMEK